MHFDNEWGENRSFKNDEENGYNLHSYLLTISY